MSVLVIEERSSSSSDRWRKQNRRELETASCEPPESALAFDTVDRQPSPQLFELPVIQDCECRVVQGVESRWMGCGYTALKYISCRCDDGVLVIEGSVTSYFFKQMAQELARHVEGIHRIQNRLIVSSTVGDKPREDRRTDDQLYE